MENGHERATAARRVRLAGFTVTPRGFQLIAAAAVWALALTIISGATVRLTGSGLGCPDWPACTNTSVVAPLQVHAWVEFGNRLINAVVSVASIGAWIAALRRRPRRRDLVFWSAGLVGGLIAEIVLGALVVEYKLAPVLVSLHFLLGLVFLAVAVILHQRAGLPDQEMTDPDGRHPGAVVHGSEAVVGRMTIRLSRLAVAAMAVVATFGTIVTSTGPHGGDPKAKRFDFSLHSVAQLHGSAAEAFVAIVLVLMWSLAHNGAPRPVIRRAQYVFVAMVAQAAVGYTQYLNGDPVALVAVHVAGASLLVIALLQFHLGLWIQPVTEPDGARDTASDPEAAGILAPSSP